MSHFKRKLASLLQCNQPLNRKAIHIKRCWDEVDAILGRACSKKKNCSCKKK